MKKSKLKKIVKKLKKLKKNEREHKSKKPAKKVDASPKITAEFVSVVKNRLDARKAKKALSVAAKDLFKPAPPPPGVLPEGITGLAMDESLNAISGWAGSYFPSAIAEGQAFLGYPYLSELLLRAEYRRMVEQIAMQMTRKWIKIVSTKSEKEKGGNEDKIKLIDAEMKRIGVREAFQKAAAMNEGFGRGHIYIDTGVGSDAEELTTDIGDGRDTTSKGKVGKKAPIRRLKNIEPVWAYPSNYNSSDPLDPSWYRPEEWYVMTKRIHASRLLTFIGREVPDMLKPAYSFGGLSLVQMAKPYVDNWLRVRQSVSDLVQAFSVMVIATDMGTATQPGGNPNLLSRLDLFNVLKDSAGIMAINKATEEFSNVSAPLGTLDQLQAQAQEHMAAVSGIPIVFLLGISPHGMNASSEGEIRVFYDWINSYQELLFRPNLTRVLGFVQLSLFGKVDPEIDFVFEPLWSMSEKEKSELKKSEADADGIDIDKGVISPAERRQRIINDPDSPYSGLSAEDVPDLQEEEEEGLIPGKGGISAGAVEEQNDKGVGKDSDVPFDQESLAHDEFNEADYPIGQPGNSGQFGPGGGGVNSGKSKMSIPAGSGKNVIHIKEV